MALDVGRVRIGMALSDITKTIASPLQSYTRKNLADDIAVICKVVTDNAVSTVVSGMPLSMDGTKNAQCLDIEGFIEELKKSLTVPVVYQDERFTTMSANRVLMESGVRREDRKKSVDKIAAAYILETYLAKLSSSFGV